MVTNQIIVLHTKVYSEMDKLKSFFRSLAQEQPDEVYKLPLKDLVEFVSKKWQLDELHGLKHWKNVHRNGVLLMQMQSNVNPFVVIAFAYLHDCCRINNGNDESHGERALGAIDEIRNTILKNFSNEEISLLKAACLLHTSIQKVGNPTIDICFDADRLDLDRVGIKPNPLKMATLRGASFADDFSNFIIKRSHVDI